MAAHVVAFLPSRRPCGSSTSAVAAPMAPYALPAAACAFSSATSASVPASVFAPGMPPWSTGTRQ